jgi:hypothetical protein
VETSIDRKLCLCSARCLIPPVESIGRVGQSTMSRKSTFPPRQS